MTRRYARTERSDYERNVPELFVPNVFSVAQHHVASDAGQLLGVELGIKVFPAAPAHHGAVDCQIRPPMLDPGPAPAIRA